ASRAKYQTAAGKLGTIRAILNGNVFKADQTYELQCLGVVLGDAFVLDLGTEWVIVEDSHGRDPAVRLPGTSILLFPLDDDLQAHRGRREGRCVRAVQRCRG